MRRCRRLVSGLAFTALAASCADLRVLEAVRTENKTLSRSLIAQKADVNAAAADGTTALHWAVEYDDLEAVDLLLKAGAHADAADRYGMTPLFYAVTNGNAPIAERLLAAGANANGSGQAGDTLLMIAARADLPEILQALLEKGASVNAADEVTRETPLMWAVRANNLKAVKILLDRGAEVSARTREGKLPERRPPGAGGGSHGVGIVRGGWPDRGYQPEGPGGMSPLLFAARDGRREIAKVLLDAKADLNGPDVNGITPLLAAISNHHLPVAQLLLERGANPKTADQWGRTPLWAAVEIRNRDIGRSGERIDRDGALQLIRALLDRGVDVNARTTEVPPVRRFVLPLGDLSWVDFTGQTAFLRAALSGDVTVMKLLLEKGADPKIPANSNTTALMAAAGVNWVVAQTFTESKESQLEAVKLCLDLGADVNAVNSMGLTAVMGAANRGSDEILQFLVDKGARLDVKDKEGRTPYNWAEGVFLATNAPEQKPATMALIKKLSGARP
ncbi:MAG TPA: ankyrin repeat domain-containing protein [Bryobacteraceae bacterium]|jgi:ankyrin repeat protein